MFRWVIREQLARWTKTADEEQTERARYRNTPLMLGLTRPRQASVFRSIICLLDEQQVRLYAALKGDLISYCWENGFHIEHPVRN